MEALIEGRAENEINWFVFEPRVDCIVAAGRRKGGSTPPLGAAKLRLPETLAGYRRATANSL